MANEITALFITPQRKGKGQLIALTHSEAFAVRGDGTFEHLFEIRRPVADTLNGLPTGRTSAWGDFIGSSELTITVEADSQSRYRWNAGAGNSNWYDINDGPAPLTQGVFCQFFAKTGFADLDSWTINVIRTNFNVGTGQYYRWDWDYWGDIVAFVNPLNRLKFLTGKTVQTFEQSCQPRLPAGWYVQFYRKHLFIGRPTPFGAGEQQNKIVWSDVHDFSEFVAKMNRNEADEYDFTVDTTTPETFYGVTGMKRLKTWLVCYTNNSIELVNYVGLPQVMQKDVVTDKIGCAFPFGLAGFHNAHLFPANDNFYMYTGEGIPRPIGDAIWPYFINDISTDPAYRYRLWSYVNQETRTVHWLYPSTASSGEIDKEVVYDYKRNVWYAGTVDNDFHSHAQMALPTGEQVIDELTSNINTYTGAIDTLGLPTGRAQYTVYGSVDKKLYRELVSGDGADDTITQSEPEIETGDFVLSLGDEVEIDGITIHAEYDDSTCDGIEVSYSLRNHAGESVSFTTVTRQLWTQDYKTELFPSPRGYGRVMRLKFKFKKKSGANGVHNAKFHGWAPRLKGMREEVER